MKQALDRLSRDMAMGVSRRKALWMFLAGTGTLGLAAKKKAVAQLPHQEQMCQNFCSQQADQFMEMCMSAVVKCPANYCPDFTTITVNSTLIPTIDRLLGVNINVNGSAFLLEETCTPLT